MSKVKILKAGRPTVSAIHPTLVVVAMVDIELHALHLVNRFEVITDRRLSLHQHLDDHMTHTIIHLRQDHQVRQRHQGLILLDHQGRLAH